MGRLSALVLAASVLSMPASSAHGQAGWDASLIVDPFPPAYLSDWELNPTLASLTVSNQTGRDAEVVIHFTVRAGDGRVVWSGRSEPQLVPASTPAVFNTGSSLGGHSDYDTNIEDAIARTGRFPEDDYTACVTLVNAGGLVVVDNLCADFSTVYPDPPYLLFPMDGDSVPAQDPIFEWTPVQVPVSVAAQYVLQIAELLPGQTPYQALTANILHYDANLLASAQQYPLGALPFEHGKRYAWWVQALDADGFPLSSNQGRSEIWTFTYLDPSRGDPGGEDIGGSVKARLVHTSQAGSGPLANLATAGYDAIRDALSDLADGELRIPLPIPNVNVFDDLPLSNVRVAFDDASRAVALTATATLPLGNVNLLLVGVWEGNAQGTFTLGIEPAAFHLGEWVDQLDGTPLDELDFNGSILTIAGAAQTLDASLLPLLVEQFYGTSTVPLEPGVSLHQELDLGNTTIGTRLAALGIEADKAEVSGSLGIDPASLFASSGAGGTPSIALAATLDGADLAALPGWLSITRYAIQFTNDPALTVTAEIGASVELPGKTLDFVLTADLGESETGAEAAFTGRLTTPWEDPLGIDWLALDSVMLEVTPANGASGTPLSAVLSARLMVGAKPVYLAIALDAAAGGLQATLTASVDELGVADLLAFVESAFGPVPLADQIPDDLAALRNVNLVVRSGDPATITVLATATVLGQSTDILYTVVPADLVGGDAPGSLFGVRLADWSLGNLIPALQGNPLGDFRFPSVSFAFGPPGVPAPPDDPNDPDASGGESGGWSIPWSSLGQGALDFFQSSYPCAGATGCDGGGTPEDGDDGSSLELRPGLNFSAPISLSALSDLFGNVFGGTGGNLPPGEEQRDDVALQGSPGVSLGDLLRGNLNLSSLLDIRGVLPPLPNHPFGWPDWLSPAGQWIQIVGDPDVHVRAHVVLEADLDGPKTFDLAAELTNGDAGGVALEGTMRGGWTAPFGLDWLSLDSVFVGLSAGSLGPRVALASAFAIGDVMASVGIDVKGTSENRTVDFDANVRNLSTADVVAFLNDAFNAGLATPTNPVTLDSLSIGFTTGGAASFDLSGGFSGGIEPVAALMALADLLPGFTAPNDVPFEIGTLAAAWFDLHVVADSVWGGYGGSVVVDGPGSAPAFEGSAAIRLGASRTGAGDDWLALGLDLAARDLDASEGLATLAGALPGNWAMPSGLDALRGASLDSARLVMALDTRSDSASAELAGAGSYTSGGGALAAALTLGLFDVADSSWARGALTVSLFDVPVSGALAQAASLLPGDWSLPADIEALAPVQLDSASLTVGFDSRLDSLSATVRGAGTMGGPSGLAATASLALVQAEGTTWAAGRLDLTVGTIPIPDALAQAAALLPGSWSLPSAVSGLTTLVLDSAALGLAFDTRAKTFLAEMTGASHLGDGAARLEGSTAFSLLSIDGEAVADGFVRFGVTNLALTGLLAQTAELLPGDWSLPAGFTSFDALRLDSAELEVGFDTRVDSLGAHAFGTGTLGDGPAPFGATADMEFTRLGDASGAVATMTLARSRLTMTEALNEIAGLLPGDWALPDGLDAFDAVSLDSARFELGFNTWTDSVFAGVWGTGGFDGLTADARLDFIQVPAGAYATGLLSLDIGAVGAGEAIARIASILPGDWSLPSGFSSFDALALDSASLFAGFDTKGDSLFAGFQGGGRLGDLSAEGRLGFARVAGSAYGAGLVTLSLGDVSLNEAFNRVTDLLPGNWPVPDVGFDLGSLRDVGLELGFDTRTDSVWAGLGARATLAQREGVAALDVVSVGSGAAARSWVMGTFRLDVGDVTIPGALSLAVSLIPGSPQIPTLDFDLGGITDAVLEAGFKVGDGDSTWAGLSGGFRLGRHRGTADLGITLGGSQAGGHFSAGFDDRFTVSDVVDLFTGFLPGGGISLPPLGPLDVGLDNARFTLDFGERTGISLGGSTELFGKTGDALFSAARIDGRMQLIFGIQIPDLGFSDIVPGFSNPVTDQLRLALAALTITQAEGEVNDEDLSPEERRFFKPLMGGRDGFTVDFTPGLNLTGLIPLANAGAMKDMVDMLTPGASNLTLQGTLPLPGMGGGLSSLALRAALPPMAPPGKPAWFVEGEVAVQITGRPSVGLAGALTVDIDGDTLTFDIESNVAIIPAGGVELSIAGGLAAKHPWVGPLGIDWLTLNEIRLALGLSPIAVRLGFLGDAVFGTKDIRLALGTKINLYTGVPIGVIVAGSSEAGLSLGDLVSVAQMVAGSDADPISTGGVPDMAVRDLDLKVATYNDPDIDVEAGFSLGGAFLLQTSKNGGLNEFGRILIDIGLDGITGLAQLAPFSIGPVHFDESLLDLALTIPDQHLVIRGGATIDNVLSADLAFAMSRDSMSFATDFDLFDLFRANLEARAGFDITNPTFAIHVALYPEFMDQLTLGIARDLLPVAQGVLQVAAGTLQAAQATLNGAQQTLDGAIWAAGEAARITMNSAYNAYKYAVRQYNHANSRYRHYRRKCSWRRPWHCASKTYWAGVRAFWRTQKSITWGVYVGARTVYQNRQFLANNPVVGAAQRALDDARAAFNAAQAEVNRIRATLNQLQQWVDAYSSCTTCGRPPIPVSVISAEFDAALAGFFGNSYVQLSLTYQLFGNRRTLTAGFGGSISQLVQPLFNAVSDALF